MYFKRRKMGVLLVKKNVCTSKKEKWVHFKRRKMGALQAMYSFKNGEKNIFMSKKRGGGFKKTKFWFNAWKRTVHKSCKSTIDRFSCALLKHAHQLTLHHILYRDMFLPYNSHVIRFVKNRNIKIEKNLVKIM